MHDNITLQKSRLNILWTWKGISANIVTPICNLENCIFCTIKSLKNVVKTFYLGLEVFLIQKHLESKRDQVWWLLYSRSFRYRVRYRWYRKIYEIWNTNICCLQLWRCAVYYGHSGHIEGIICKKCSTVNSFILHFALQLPHLTVMHLFLTTLPPTLADVLNWPHFSYKT